MNVGAYENGELVEREDIPENWKATIASKLEKSALSAEEKQWVDDHLGKDVETLKRLRRDIINKHGFALGVIKMTFGLSDEDIDQGLKDIDAGELDEDELVKKSPVKVGDMDRLVAITKEIKKQLGNTK